MLSPVQITPAETNPIEKQCNCRNKSRYCDSKLIARDLRPSFIFIAGHSKGSATDPVLCLVPIDTLGFSGNISLRNKCTQRISQEEKRSARKSY